MSYNQYKGVIHKHLVKDDPCWENYEMVGTKVQDGKEVPNCVPKKEKDNEATIKGPEPNKRSPAAYQKEANRLVNRVRYKKWGDKEIYELRANGKQYRSDDPGDVVDQAMQDAGWPPMRGGRGRKR